MSSKHFINDPTQLVDDALHAITLTNPAVSLDSQHRIVYANRAQSASQVSIISGGGSGHEPSFSAYVGEGLLTAAVCGTIFASPSSEQVLAAIENHVDTTAGVLVSVMNYTGDMLNFGVAVEKAKAASPNLKIEVLVVDDDVGVPRSMAGKVGRRGIAGTVLIHKITGALAARGAPLEEVSRIGRLATRNLVSVGASLERVHVPGRRALGTDEGLLAAGEVELGMGIHNEPGSGRVKAELPELVTEMLRQLLDQNDKERAFLNVNSDQVVLMVNNLGGISVLELGGILAQVEKQLEQTYHIRPVRIYAGTFMTSLNGLGFSISLLNVVDSGIDGASLIDLLDAPSKASGWNGYMTKQDWQDRKADGETKVSKRTKKTVKDDQPSGLTCNREAFQKRLTAGLDAVIAAEPEVTKYDTIVGDGDCGTTLKRGAESILSLFSSASESSLPPATNDLPTLVDNITQQVSASMDGTSGALYTIFMNALLQSLRAQSAAASSSSTPTTATLDTWLNALEAATTTLRRYTPARVGDRTLVDALDPFVETLKASRDLGQAAKASEAGAEKTRGMRAKLGRAVYVGGGEETFREVPDPGAWGLAKFFGGLAKGE